MSVRPHHLLLAAAWVLPACLRVAAAEGVEPRPAVPAMPAMVAPAPEPDPRVLLGVLPNGLRYAVRPQAVPPGRVSLFLYVDAGSRYETEHELGYAHFVEHLAFAGSRDFPGDSAIRTLQRFGLGFGSEVNAATGRNYTVYEIRNVPLADPAALTSALRVLRNYADGLLFAPDAVERERGVILAEGNVRAGRIAYWWGRELEFLPPHSDELNDNELAGLFAGTALARPQIGTPRSIKRATPEGLRAFYDRWYRPERMLLAVAGELEPHAIAASIHAELGGVAARGPAGAPVVPIPAPAEAGRGRARFFVDPDSPVEIVTLAAAVPRTAGAAREELAEALALAMLVRRLGRTSEIAAEVEGFVARELPGWNVPILRMRTAPNDWPGAAVALETEVRRAARLGFAPEELDVARAARHQQVVAEERDAPNRTAAEVALALAHAHGRGGRFTSAASERQWVEETLVRLTPEDCRAAVERLWPEHRTQFVLTGPGTGQGGEFAEVRRAIERARKAQPEPYRPTAATAGRLPEDFGPPGEAVAMEHVPALDSWLVQFDNGVRLNFKYTGFEHRRVRVRLGFGHGLLGTDPGREGLVFGIAALCHGGLAELSPEQERDLLARNEIKASFGFGADRFGFSAAGAADGLDTVLRLFAARLARPGFRNAGLVAARAFIEEQLTRYDRTAPGVAEDRLREHLFGGHHALTRPRRAGTEQLSFDDMRAWLEPQLLGSPLEITVVGDIGLDEVTAAVGRTLGALPLRSTVDPLADRRLCAPGEVPAQLEARFAGRRTVGSVALAWRLPDVVGQEDDCRMRLLGAVLEDRVRVRLRQEMGKTYTPVVGLLAERALAPAMLFLRCRIETAPRYLSRVTEAAKTVVAELVRDGIAPEELERARLPLVRQAEDNLTSNSWWVTVLGEAQSKPQYIEGQGEQARLYASVTKAELDALARLLFAADRLCEVRAVPD